MPKQNVIVRKKKDKAVRAIKKGQISEAVRLLEQLTGMVPNDPNVWIKLASIHGQQGDFDAVAKCCRHALAINPRQPTAASMLGNTLALQGRHEEAKDCYRNALMANPNDPGVLNNFSNALYISGELEKAAKILSQVVKLKPTYADAHNNLGNIYKALNRSSEAIQHFQWALKLNPQLFETWLNLGNIFSDRIGFPEAAENCFRKALALKPDDIEAESGLTNMLCFQGRLDEALMLIHKSLVKQPNNFITLAQEADILERQGDFETSYKKVRTLLQQNATNAMAAGVLMRLCRRFDCCDEAIKLGEALINDDTINDTSHQTLHFELGKLHDKLRNYDQAFEHYRRSNEMTGAPFDAQGYQDKFRDIIQAYSKEALDRLPKANHGDSRPVFIVGLPRSGTSLTEQILASHPEIHGAGELNDINDIAAGLKTVLGSQKSYPYCIEDLTQIYADQLAGRYRERLDSFSKTAVRVTDKMPHNFMNLGLIALLFPQARIIHCERDPRDTCLSIYFQSFGWLHPYATDLSHVGFYYRLYHELMQHWKSDIGLPIMTVNYEDMVNDQERTSRKLVEFIGLEWDENCLKFHRTKRTVATASYDQVRQPMYTKSMARWKHYEKHIGPLLKALGT